MSVLVLGISLCVWPYNIPNLAAVAFASDSSTTTIIMVRHAERDEGANPPLNSAGEARAAALAALLGDENIAAIYFPDYIRNQQTALPLIARLPTSPAIHAYPIDQSNDTKLLAERFVQDVMGRYAGGTVLWIGNTGPMIKDRQSGNLQEIFARLGGEGRPPVEYDDIFTIVLTEGQNPLITKAKYGQQSGSAALSSQ